MVLITFANSLLNCLARATLRDSVVVGRNSRVSYKDILVKRGCRIYVGDDSSIEGKICCERDNASIRIGDRCFIGGSTMLICSDRIHVGDDVLISWGCTIVDHNSHSIVWKERRDDVVRWMKGEKDWSGVPVSGVTIEDKVWLGFNVIVLKGLTIGEGAIVGAGSVVTRDVSPYTIVAGNPARLVREIPPHER